MDVFDRPLGPQNPQPTTLTFVSTTSVCFMCPPKMAPVTQSSRFAGAAGPFAGSPPCSG